MPTRQVREARPRESAVTIVYQVEPGVDPGLMVCVKQMPVRPVMVDPDSKRKCTSGYWASSSLGRLSFDSPQELRSCAFEGYKLSGEVEVWDTKVYCSLVLIE